MFDSGTALAPVVGIPRDIATRSSSPAVTWCVLLCCRKPPLLPQNEAF